MKKLISYTFSMLFAFQVLAKPSVAAGCEVQAAALAASKGGSVLSVSSQGDKCRIKLLIRSSDGPPVTRTFVVNK